MTQILRLALVLALPITSYATSKPTFPPIVEAHGARMTLRGEALLRVGYIFRVYWAALHVGEGVPTEDVLKDVPKRLEIVYLRHISAADLIKAGDEMLRRHLTPQELAAIQTRLDAINKLYRDVRPGDRYTLTYVPGIGSELAFNGQPLGVIPGADFAAPYFGIWLDPRTDYKDFQAALLGRRR
jgi:hypothetical protein